MTLNARLARRLNDHGLFARHLPDVRGRAECRGLRDYVASVTDANMAGSDASDRYKARALGRMEDALPGPLGELDMLIGKGLAAEPPIPRPGGLDAESAAVLAAALEPAATNCATHEALFDAILALAGERRLPAGQPALELFTAAYHELVSIRVREGDARREIEAMQKAAALFDEANAAIDALGLRGGLPRLELSGDGARLNRARLLPPDWQYRAVASSSKRSTPASDAAGVSNKKARKNKKMSAGNAKLAVSAAALAVGDAAATERTTPTVLEPLGAQRNTSNSAASTSSSGRAFASEHLDENVVYHAPIDALRPHPDNDRLFAPVDVAAQRELEQDIREHGAEHPLLVCGTGCTSPRGTILRGHRRHAALVVSGAATAPVMFKNSLAASDEVFEMVRGNLADSHARKLTEEGKFLLEEEVRRAAGERRGRPPAGSNSVDSNGISGSETAAVVAEQLKEKPNAVRDRRKIFGSPCSTAKLRKAVNGLKARVSPAAALVRQIERQFGLARGAAADADDGVIQAAQVSVDQLLAAMLAGEPRRRQKPKPPTPVQPTSSAGPAEATPIPIVSAESGVHPALAHLDALEAAASEMYQSLLSSRDPADATAGADNLPVLEILAPIVEGALRSALVRATASVATAQPRLPGAPAGQRSRRKASTKGNKTTRKAS